jgi:hypothetical protein
MSREAESSEIERKGVLLVGRKDSFVVSLEDSSRRR